MNRRRHRWIIVACLAASVASGCLPVGSLLRSSRTADVVPPTDLRVAADIIYDGASEPLPRDLNCLDVYYTESGKDRPVVVFFHGGAWRRGSKRHGWPKSELFTSQGVVFVAPNYRLSPTVKHPAHVQDAAKAVAWAKAHAAEFGGDTSKLFLCGHSAGGHLAALLATDERYLRAEGLGLADLTGVILIDAAGLDLPTILDRGSATVSWWVYYDAFGNETPGWVDASPITHVSDDKPLPPTLLIHSGGLLTNLADSKAFQAALDAAGATTELVYNEQKNHFTIYLDLGEPNDPATEAIFRFIDTHDN